MITGQDDGRSSDNNDGRTCAVYFTPGYEGNYDYLDWSSSMSDLTCALYNDENNNIDWTPYNDYYGFLVLQKNLPYVSLNDQLFNEVKQWRQTSATNLSAFRALSPAQTLAAKNNLVNLQATFKQVNLLDRERLFNDLI
jgi:hypothetical protein